MRAPAQSGDFQLAPPGSHLGYLVRLIDLGTTYNEMYSKNQHKIILMYELTNALMEPNDDGEQRPFLISEWLTLSMNEKANLRKRIETWRGKAFDNDEEAESFDIEKLLGQKALITVIHGKTKKGDERAQIASVILPPAGTPMPDRVNDKVLFDLSDFNKETFELLSDKLQGLIKESHEYREIYGEHKQSNNEPPQTNIPPQGSATPLQQHSQMDDSFDDDIPF